MGEGAADAPQHPPFTVTRLAIELPPAVPEAVFGRGL